MSDAPFVISEIYTAGGTSPGGYNTDYIVIHNNTTTSQSLSGYTLRQTSGAGTIFNNTFTFGDVTVDAGKYYLIKLGIQSATGTPIPTPDLFVSNITLSTAGGKIALTDSTFTGANSIPNQPGIVDYVGYGTANRYEGSGPAPAPTGTTRLVRANQGTVDSNDNATDLTVTAVGTGTPSPKNSSSDAYIVCFGPGTRIRTAHGDVPVENLAVGDFGLTASSESRPIRWIGHRTMACQGRKDVMPVRIAANAFGEGRPSRDLFVSPAHAIAVDVLGEVLIPAYRLINGTTITQVDVETITYWHVELDSHDILLAEGLPAESYLDCGNRRFFANADATDLMTAPDARPEGPLPFCRPFHEAGPVVDLVRARLQDRAVALGWRKVEEAFTGLHVVGKLQRLVLPSRGTGPVSIAAVDRAG